MADAPVSLQYVCSVAEGDVPWIDAFEATYRQVEELLRKLPESRYRARALTNLAESVAWAVKALPPLQ